MAQYAFKGNVYKRCGCKDPASGKRRGSACPRLRRRNGSWSSDHGTWSYQAELPRRPNGDRRRPIRRGGFASYTEAQEHVDNIRSLIEVGQRRDKAALMTVADLLESFPRRGGTIPRPDDIAKQLDAGTDLGDIPTVGEWLQTWLAGRRKLRGSTKLAYSSHMRLWLIPHLGHYPLNLLKVEHVSRMFDAMAERNDIIAAAKTSDDAELRNSVRNLRIMGAATMQRYRATLRAALNAAIRSEKITFNPASFVELPSGRRPKALLWTAERVKRWRRTGERPSRVMVWTPEQIGRFLDHADGHTLYPLFHLIAHRGLRRGEACGLHWWDTDLPNQTITITSALVQLGWNVEFGEPKSEASGRIISLDNATTDVLREQKIRQDRRRAAVGDDWPELGLTFTNPDGTPLHPAKVTDAFHELADAAELPPVRLHDLRHGAATLMLAAGADLKVVQELLGHASITITADTYAHVLPELARDTAEAAAAIVPRRGQLRLPAGAGQP